MKIFIDGKWVGREQAKVSVFDHGLLYGDGVFEGLRAYNGVVFRLREHLDRLYRSASLVSLKIPLPAGNLGRLVEEALAKNKLRDAYIRLLVTRGAGDLGLDPRVCKKPNVIIIADKLALFPKACYTNGLQSIVAKTRRTIAEALDPSIKSMNYLNNILAKIEANEANVPEAIMLNARGFVSECSGDNVFFIKGEVVVTPPVSAGVLEGITRSAVLDIVKTRTPYKTEERLFPPDDLFGADEVFFTGTAAEIIPVTMIDGHSIGDGKPGSKTLELISHFHSVIKEETSSR